MRLLPLLVATCVAAANAAGAETCNAKSHLARLHKYEGADEMALGAMAPADLSATDHQEKSSALRMRVEPSTTEDDSSASVTTATTQLSGGAAVTALPWKGIMGVLGGAMCHLVLGSTYCWGNFLPYAPPHLKFFSGTGGPGQQPDALWVLPGAFLAQMVGMPCSAWFQRNIGCQKTVLLGCWIMALGVFLSSYATNLALFLLAYSGLFGIGVGIAYTAPMVNGWRWFPNRKGLVSGAVVAGFGSGGFIFNQVGSKLVNPSGLNAIKGTYPAEIYANFPVMLRKLALIYFVMAGLGALFVTPPPSTGASPAAAKANAAATSKAITVKEALAGTKFWVLWSLALLSGVSGINVAGVYKQYAGTLDHLRSDSFQSLVGSIGALCNGAGRLFWGNMLDAYGFKTPFTVLTTIQALIMASYTALSQSKPGFAVATCVVLFCLGGNFAMFPAATTRTFGATNGAAIYGMLFSAFGMASISGTFITKGLQAQFGWDGVFKVMSVLSVVVLAIIGAQHTQLA